MWYQVKSDKITLTCRVKPNARKSEILGINKDYLQVALQAPPVDGAANLALIKFLAKIFHLPSRDVLLLRGAKSRIKVVELPNDPQLHTLLTQL